MDSRKKAGRDGKKITIRDGDADEALKTLKSKSDFADPVDDMSNAEESEAEADFLDDEQELDNSEDIAKFLKKSKIKDSAEVPEKTDKKTRKKKAAKKRQAKIKGGIKVALVIIFLIAICGSLGFFLLRPKIEQIKLAKEESVPLESDKIYYSPLTGLEVPNQEATTAAATCVMIENSPDARPQSGLAEAGVVFEAVAEGGITRFMAIYQEAKPQLIGPVRSLRITYAEEAKPYQCSLLHMGGADNALSLVRNNSAFRDLEGMYYEGKWVWRQNTAIAGKRRYAPHNVYTNFEKLDALNYQKGYNNSTFGGFARVNPDDPKPEVEQNATWIKIKMSSDLYNPTFTYNADTNTYTRSHTSGGIHQSIAVDGSALNITPTVVVAAKVDAVRRPGPDGYTDYTTIGTNDAFIFQDGTVTIGKWKRDTADNEMQFIDGDGNIIKLNRGQTWISLYPSNSGSVDWN